jgi:hypothetical protein
MLVVLCCTAFHITLHTLICLFNYASSKSSSILWMGLCKGILFSSCNSMCYISRLLKVAIYIYIAETCLFPRLFANWKRPISRYVCVPFIPPVVVLVFRPFCIIHASPEPCGVLLLKSYFRDDPWHLLSSYWRGSWFEYLLEDGILSLGLLTGLLYRRFFFSECDLTFSQRSV